jgi:hypothetical protein
VILPVIVFGLALLIAPNRGLALIFVGLTVMAGAILRIVLLMGPIESVVIDLAVGNDAATAAARAAYDALAGSFVAQDLLVLAGGFAAFVVGIVWAIRGRASY